MNVVWTDRSLEDIYLICGADLSDDVSKPETYIVLEYFLSVLGNPDNMELVVINCMACAFVPRHEYSMLKPWTKVQSFPLSEE